MTPHVKCLTCNEGDLHRKKVFRLGAPIGFLGAFLVYPAYLLLAVLVIWSMASCSAISDEDPTLRSALADKMQEAGVPEGLANRAASGETISEPELANLTDEQREMVTTVPERMAIVDSSKVIAGGILAGLTVPLFALAFVLILVGWILRMRKRILQCSNCGAVTPAS